MLINIPCLTDAKESEIEIKSKLLTSFEFKGVDEAAKKRKG